MTSICSICKDDAFRFCLQCLKYYCPEHICDHLRIYDVELGGFRYEEGEEDSGKSFLSNGEMLATISTETIQMELQTARSRVILLAHELESRLDGNIKTSFTDESCYKIYKKKIKISPTGELVLPEVMAALKQMRRLVKKDKRVVEFLKGEI